MAWGDARSAADLKKEILESEEIKKLQTTLDGVSTGLDDKIKSAVTEATKGHTETLEGLKNTLASLAAKLTPPNKDGKGGEGEGSSGEEADWMLEPEKAATKLVNDKIGGVTTAVANMRADMNYTSFKNTAPRGFVQFEKEIKEMWDKETLVTRQNPKIIENIYKIVVANHIDEIAKGGESFFVEPSTSSTRSNTEGPKKKPEELLTKDELEQAKKWGVTAEEYLKEKDAIAGVTTYA